MDADTITRLSVQLCITILAATTIINGITANRLRRRIEALEAEHRLRQSLMAVNRLIPCDAAIAASFELRADDEQGGGRGA